MKPAESDQSTKNMNNSKEQKKSDEMASTSSKDPAEESDLIKDELFEPTVDMLVNDFDEEQTLEEEEALAAKDGHDPGVELNDLQRESEMPIEELMKLYGYGQPMAESSSSGSSSRKRRRRQDKSPPSPPKQVKKEEIETTVQNAADESTVTIAEDADSPDEDATTTTTTNNLENTSVVDDETNYEDEEEPSELKKLYEEEEDLYMEDVDYIPEEEGKKTIMVGSDYQAVIPEGLREYDDALPYENEDKLLWDPSKLSDIDLEDYLNKFSATQNGHSTTASTTTGQSQLSRSRRDDEQALLLLLQCGNNLEEALRRRRLGPIQPTSIWSEEECRNFENGIKLFGKSFHEIQSTKVSQTRLNY